MNSTRLQDDHTSEVCMLVHDLLGYIEPPFVKIVLDVGSRNAKESIALKGFFSNARVYAFECNPPAIELCKQNIGSRTDITLITKAVSDVNGTVDFFAIDPEKTVTSHADGNIGASSLFVANPDYPYEKYHQEKITVESITLEQWAESAGVQDIDIMWIDLQGAELKAFQGMGNLLSRTKVIYTEIEFKKIYLGQPLFREVDSYLSARGFCLLKLYPSGWSGNALYVQNDLVQGMRLATSQVRKYFALGRVQLSLIKQYLTNSFRCNA